MLDDVNTKVQSSELGEEETAQKVLLTLQVRPSTPPQRSVHSLIAVTPMQEIREASKVATTPTRSPARSKGSPAGRRRSAGSDRGPTSPQASPDAQAASPGEPASIWNPSPNAWSDSDADGDSASTGRQTLDQSGDIYERTTGWNSSGRHCHFSNDSKIST